MCVKDRCRVPTGLGGVRAHALGDDAKPGCAARLSRQLQPPSLAEVQRTGDLQDYKGQPPAFQRLLGYGKCVGLILRARQQQSRNIENW